MAPAIRGPHSRGEHAMSQNPPLRRGLTLGIALIAWLYFGAWIFGVQSPWVPWFDALAPGDKVKVGAWLCVAVLMLSEALFLLRHGLFGDGRRR
jgi:hypothetical protein